MGKKKRKKKKKRSLAGVDALTELKAREGKAATSQRPKCARCKKWGTARQTVCKHCGSSWQRLGRLVAGTRHLPWEKPRQRDGGVVSVERARQERRRQFTFSVLSWNVLFDGTAQDEFKRAHGRVVKAVVGWEARKPRLLNELRRVNSDVLLLSECNHFDDFWQPCLGALGFEGIWTPKFSSTLIPLADGTAPTKVVWPVPGFYRGRPSDGCAVFFRRERFRAVWSKRLRLQDGAPQVTTQALLVPADGGSGPHVVVGACHLKVDGGVISILRGSARSRGVVSGGRGEGGGWCSL